MNNDLQHNVLLKYFRIFVDYVNVCIFCVWWDVSWFGDVAWWVPLSCSYCGEQKDVLNLIYFHKILINYIRTRVWARRSVVLCMRRKKKGNEEVGVEDDDCCSLVDVISATTPWRTCVKCVSSLWRSVGSVSDGTHPNMVLSILLLITCNYSHNIII